MKINDWTLRGVYPDNYEDIVYSFYGRRGVVPGDYSPYPSGTIRADKTEVTTPGGCNMVCYAINTYRYQWETSRDGTNYTKMQGEITNELSQFYPHITGAGGNHYYRCICGGYMGDSTTEPVKIVVSYHLPVIHITSDKAIITAPGSITFSVDASQYATAYQWQKNGVDITGATSTNYTESYAYGDGGTFTYTCKATGLGGETISNSVIVNVIEPLPTVIITPDKTAVTTPDSITITAETTYAETYQWMLNGADIEGATESTYSKLFAYGDAGTYTYNCKVTGLGGTVTSNAVIITVTEHLPEITIESDKTEVVTPGGIIITATTTYAESYQWFENGGEIPEATGLTLPRLYAYGEAGTYNYVCKATGLGGETISNTVTMTVSDPEPTVIVTPAEITIKIGETATLTATATYTDSYQWKKNGENIEGATEATYTTEITSAVSFDVYVCVVTGLGGTVTSNEARVTIEE